MDLARRASNETAEVESFKVGCYHIDGWLRVAPTCLNWVALFHVKVRYPLHRGEIRRLHETGARRIQEHV